MKENVTLRNVIHSSLYLLRS